MIAVTSGNRKQTAKVMPVHSPRLGTHTSLIFGPRLCRGDGFCGLPAVATRKLTRICSLVRASACSPARICSLARVCPIARWHALVPATILDLNRRLTCRLHLPRGARGRTLGLRLTSSRCFAIKRTSRCRFFSPSARHAFSKTPLC